MAQEYGAAQPIFDAVKKIKNKASDLINGGPVKRALPAKKQDTSWHDEQVKEATASFGKNTNGKTKVGGSSKTKTVAKKRTSKSGARKISTKR